MDDVKLALLGDHEAAKRLTEAGIQIPCPICGEEKRVRVAIWERILIDYYGVCENCNCTGPVEDTERAALLAWNTRAPILSESELKKLEETT